MKIIRLERRINNIMLYYNSLSVINRIRTNIRFVFWFIRFCHVIQ